MNYLDSAADISAWGSVSPDAVQFIVSEMRKRELIGKSESPDAKEIAETLCLADGNRLTMAGAALLCARPDRFIEGAYIKIGSFGADGTLQKEDVIKEPLILQPNVAIRRLYEKYLESKVVYGNLHIDSAYEYPASAVKEAVINACAHRDFVSGCPVEIRVFPNSLSIYNCGGLPEGWTVSNLLGEHRSKPRNVRIADAFHDAGLMQCWGKGIEAIANACKTAETPMPEFFAGESDFTAVFPAEFSAPKIECQEEVGPAIQTESDLEDRIVEIISEGKLRTGQEISDALGMNRRQFTRVMSKLMEEGRITREGSRRKGRWIANGQTDGRN
jgi:ATP-dependent DNA helicase RecG